MERQDLKKAAFAVGELAQKSVDKTNQLLEQHHVRDRLKAKASELGDSAKQTYEEQTGRNAHIDATIVKVSAIATAGAVAVSALPMVGVGLAVGGAIVGVAKAKGGEIAKTVGSNYEAVSGRSAEKDARALQVKAQSGLELGKELTGDFRQGMQAQQKKNLMSNVASTGTSGGGRQ